MKSYVIHAFPYQNVDISRFRKKLQYDEKAIEHELQRLQNRGVTWSEGAPAAAGDVVQCRLDSQLDRFRREKLSLTIGAGLFDAELEEAMIGRNAGDTFYLDKDGYPVTAEVICVRNKHLPELCDKLVQELALPDIHTVAEYRKYLKEQQFEQQFYQDVYPPAEQIKETVLAESEICLHREDWRKYVKLRLTQLKHLAEYDGLELEKMTPEQFEGRIPVKSFDGLIALLQEEAWECCCISLLGREFAAEDGFAVTQEAYEQFLKETAADWKQPVEKYRMATPYELYECNAYAHHYHDRISSYLKENLYVEG